jgi:hypothetical protein
METMTHAARVRIACPPAVQTAGVRRFLRAPLALLMALAFLLPPASCAAYASSQPVGEYHVKAAFILNFANFIEWPNTAPSSDAFIIGILGRDPFEGAIDSLKGKTVKGRKVVIKRYDDPEDARDADILFISASEKRALPRILKSLRNRPVLTVGDSQGFVRSGVMISMVPNGKRVGFEINNRAAQQAGIRISSQLLKLAREVIEP